MCHRQGLPQSRRDGRRHRPRLARGGGALADKRDSAEELAFASRLLRALLEGFHQARLALHVCRGNWSRDESVALRGPCTPLLSLFQSLPVGTFFLEMATPRAGDVEALPLLLWLRLDNCQGFFGV
jgi:hypothetical protein